MRVRKIAYPLFARFKLENRQMDEQNVQQMATASSAWMSQPTRGDARLLLVFVSHRNWKRPAITTSIRLASGATTAG